MKSCDPVLFRELPIIQKIIQDETWLEGERRGCFVAAGDTVVRERVCEVVLRVGQELRESLSGGPYGPVLGVPSNVVPMPAPNSDEAA